MCNSHGFDILRNYRLIHRRPFVQFFQFFFINIFQFFSRLSFDVELEHRREIHEIDMEIECRIAQ